MGASQSVGSLHYDLDITDEKLGATLDASDKKVASFGDRLGQLGGQIQQGMKDAAKGLAVIGAGLTIYAKQATDYTTGLVKDTKALSRQLGVTQEEASRLTAAVGRLGISAEDAGQMYGIFQKNIAKSTESTADNRLATEKLNIEIAKTKASIKATTEDIKAHGDKTGELSLKLRELNNNLANQQNELGKSADSFAKLGISTVDAKGKQKDFETILFETADKFKSMPDGIDKTTLALDLFGRSGKDMVKVLNLGASGIQDLEKQADKLGLTLTADTIGKINAMVESQKKLKEQTDAMKIAVGTATAPVLTEFNRRMLELTTAAIGANSPIHALAIQVLAFGGPVSAGAAAILGFAANISSMSKQMGAVLLRMGLFILAAVAIGLIVYGLIQAFGGWDNVMKTMGPTLQAVWNVLAGMASLMAQVLWPSIVALGDAFMKNLWPALVQLWQAVVQLWNALNPALTVALGAIAAIIFGLLVGALYVGINMLKMWIQVISWTVGAIASLIGYIAGMVSWFGNAIVWVGKLIGAFWALPGVMQAVAAAIPAPFKAAFNAIASLWNRTMGNLTFNVPGWVPGIGGRGWSLPKIPYLAKGGIATGPTTAVIGEAGSEVVMPLTQLARYTSLFDRIEKAAGLSGEGGKGDTTYQIANVNLNGAEAVDEFFSIGNRNTQLEMLGGSPLAGTTGV